MYNLTVYLAVIVFKIYFSVGYFYFAKEIYKFAFKNIKIQNSYDGLWIVENRESKIYCILLKLFYLFVHLSKYIGHFLINWIICDLVPF